MADERSSSCSSDFFPTSPPSRSWSSLFISATIGAHMCAFLRVGPARPLALDAAAPIARLIPIPDRQPTCTCVACGRGGARPCAQGSSSTYRRSACRWASSAASSRGRGERPRRSRCLMRLCDRCRLWPSGRSCARCGGCSPPAPVARESCAPRRARRWAGGTAERRMWPTVVRIWCAFARCAAPCQASVINLPMMSVCVPARRVCTSK